MGQDDSEALFFWWGLSEDHCLWHTLLELSFLWPVYFTKHGSQLFTMQHQKEGVRLCVVIVLFFVIC